MCADGSQHLHESNRINSCYIISLRNFFLENIFIFFVAFWSFFMSEHLVLDFHQEKFSCNADIEMPNPSCGRHWIAQCLQIVSRKQNNWRRKNLCIMFQDSFITFYVSPVTCHQNQQPQPQILPLLTTPICTVGWFGIRKNKWIHHPKRKC